MKVLVYGNRKMDAILWDASTKDLEAAAYLALFTYLDTEWQVYADLKEPVAWDEPDTPSKQRQWYDRAAKGDAEAARLLLGWRKARHYEYEDGWDIHSVLRPKKVKVKNESATASR